MIRLQRLLARLEKAGSAAEDALLVGMLSAMIVLAAGQIVLRNVFDSGFFWTDELLRLMVLWLAMAGAIAASRRDKHISIAVLDRFLPATLGVAVKVLIAAFTAGVCTVIAWHSFRFVQTSHEYGDTVLLSVPAWAAQLILPAGFALIAYRYALLAVKHLRQLLSRTAP